MKAQKGNWTPEDLDNYLTNPQGQVPGTNMTFAGIPRGKERADLITYLNCQVGQAGAELPEGGRSRARRRPAGSAASRWWIARQAALVMLRSTSPSDGGRALGRPREN